MTPQRAATTQAKPNFLFQIAVFKFFTLQLSVIFAAVNPAIRQLAPPVTGVWQPATHFRLRISMDRISDSDSEDAGSIPAGATNEADPEVTTSRGLLQGRFIVLKRSP